MSEWNNLDRLAARIAQKIVAEGGDAGKLEILATKTLGVVQENGVYAGLLFLYSRPKAEEDQARAIRDNLLAILGADEITTLNLRFPEGQSKPDRKGQWSTDKWADVAQHVTDHVTVDLDKLLLVKELYEQTLIYVRYGAKAAGGR